MHFTHHSEFRSRCVLCVDIDIPCMPYIGPTRDKLICCPHWIPVFAHVPHERGVCRPAARGLDHTAAKPPPQEFVLHTSQVVGACHSTEIAKCICRKCLLKIRTDA